MAIVLRVATVKADWSRACVESFVRVSSSGIIYQA